jgi:hypothetical protein
MNLHDIELVDLRHFMQATRDSGYRGLGSALSEVIDNSLQAGARRVEIVINDGKENDDEPYIAVVDDGCGMAPALLRRALQFGGSDRFDDRSGLGRFGMGLPNSSLSQARRVDVYTWRCQTAIWHAYLDLNELLTVPRPCLAAPRRRDLPWQFHDSCADSGTLVLWRDLDRRPLEGAKAMVARLERQLGQAFRHFLWNNCTITLNGNPIHPYDPLCLSTQTHIPWISARQYGETLQYPVAVGDGLQSVIEVRFSEIPVDEYGSLPSEEKRRFGIVSGAGVSVVRASREIDYGWFLIGKRRENYDDWWRCEIRFDPELDELFGVTHFKQGIRPTETLRSIMTPELGRIARTLNRRIRTAHVDLAVRQVERAAGGIASRNDVLLRPLPVAPPVSEGSAASGKRQYNLVLEKIDERVFLQTRIEEGCITVALNTMHEFFREVYGPLADVDNAQFRRHLRQMELLLFALGRTLHLERSPSDQAAIQAFLADWSRAIAAFCGAVTR